MRTLLRLIFLVLLLAVADAALAVTQPPYTCTTTTRLNVRSGPGKGYQRIDCLERGRTVTVTDRASGDWVKVSYSRGSSNKSGYVSSRYLSSPKAISAPQSADSPLDSVMSGGDYSWVGTLIGWILKAALVAVVLFLVLTALKIGVPIILNIFSVCFRIISLPFFALNVLQRYLAKPWMVFYKFNNHSDSTNATLREVYRYAQIPFYILLTPVRFVNAVYFNMLTHCTFELYNYVLEVLSPSQRSEGRGDLVEWIVNLPVRIVKYPLWHGSLTIVESAIWTIADTFVPALTLFHGTSCTAADSIVACADRGGRWGNKIGIWCVGAGNFAGNGIYFAPARSTAVYYSGGQSLIVCRVSLGRTIDLGLAPKYVYRECGHADAFNATRWGLNHGYVTGEWWRSDRRWWEYCMYDWKNRYNHSWRIRPLYVLDLKTNNIMPIPGGMSHWLFRQLVIDDLTETFSNL